MRPDLRRAALRVRHLWRDERGAIAVIFGISIFALFMMTALAVDYGRMIALRQRAQSALDSAILNAVRTRTTDDKAKLATRLFTASLQAGDTPTQATFAYDGTGRVLTGTARFDLPMTLGSGWGASMPIAVRGKSESYSDKVRVVDIAICVQATAGSTAVGVLKDAVKGTGTPGTTGATGTFSVELERLLKAYGVPAFDQIRIRPIYYRDWGGFAVLFSMVYWGSSGINAEWKDALPPDQMGEASGDKNALVAKKFYDANDESSSLEKVTSAETPSGGGYRDASGLECINEAMSSPWMKVGDSLSTTGKSVDIVYPFVVVLSNNPAHPTNFLYSVQNPHYPTDMPRDDATLALKWRTAVAAQPNLSLLFSGLTRGPGAYGRSSQHYMTPFPPVGESELVQNGFQQIDTWPGYTWMGESSTGSSTVESIAKALAESYSRTTLAQ